MIGTQVREATETQSTSSARDPRNHRHPLPVTLSTLGAGRMFAWLRLHPTVSH